MLIKFFKERPYSFRVLPLRYKANKKQCGRKKVVLTTRATALYQGKNAEGWTP